MGLAALLGTALRKQAQGHFFAFECGQAEGQGLVAHVLQASHGFQSIGSSRMSGYKNQIAGLGAAGIPLHVRIAVQGLAVFVDSEEAHVKVIARIFEVVGVSTVEGGALLGSHNQAHIGVFFVAIEVIGSA